MNELFDTDVAALKYKVELDLREALKLLIIPVNIIGAMPSMTEKYGLSIFSSKELNSTCLL